MKISFFFFSLFPVAGKNSGIVLTNEGKEACLGWVREGWGE